MTEPGTLLGQAESFAAEVTDVLAGVLPQAPAALAEVTGDRVLVQPESRVKLFVNDQSL